MRRERGQGVRGVSSSSSSFSAPGGAEWDGTDYDEDNDGGTTELDGEPNHQHDVADKGDLDEAGRVAA